MKLISRLMLAGLVLLGSAQVQAGAYDDLIAAVYRDDTETVVGLLQRGMDVNSVDPAGNTLLHVAARNGNAPLLEFLLNNRANPLARNRVGDTALLLAAYYNKPAAVERLLAGGAEINPKGWTPLQYAVFAGHPEMVKYLIEKGSNIDARAPNQQTALMFAARMGDLQIANYLIEAKADWSLKDQHGETAESIAIKANNTVIASRIKQYAEANPGKAPEPSTNPAPAAAPQPAPIPESPVVQETPEPTGQPFMTEKY